MTPSNCYSACMWSEKLRRILSLLTALVLAVGLVAHGLGSPDILDKSAVAAANDLPMSSMPMSGMPMSGMPMSGKCNGCAGDEKGMGPAACSALCDAVIALPLVAVMLHTVRAETLSPVSGPNAIGHANPPDPYPPRPTSLS
jgi:hypothetical protein